MHRALSITAVWFLRLASSAWAESRQGLFFSRFSLLPSLPITPQTTADDLLIDNSHKSIAAAQLFIALFSRDIEWTQEKLYAFNS